MRSDGELSDLEVKGLKPGDMVLVVRGGSWRHDVSRHRVTRTTATQVVLEWPNTHQEAYRFWRAGPRVGDEVGARGRTWGPWCVMHRLDSPHAASLLEEQRQRKVRDAVRERVAKLEDPKVLDAVAEVLDRLGAP